ncbi:hypothetical protein [Lactobacillus selangorensis]|nr:hypothetical protein [Lactobacillus selangorensis]
MNKTQQRAVNYANEINSMISITQDNQDKMDPYYEKLKTAIADNKVADISAADYKKTQTEFQTGTDHYKKALINLKNAKAPARLIGNHHILSSAYQQFVDGCQMMCDSLGDDKKVNVEMFHDAEKAQDEATDRMSRAIQKIMA